MDHTSETAEQTHQSKCLKDQFNILRNTQEKKNTFSEDIHQAEIYKKHKWILETIMIFKDRNRRLKGRLQEKS